MNWTIHDSRSMRAFWDERVQETILNDECGLTKKKKIRFLFSKENKNYKEKKIIMMFLFFFSLHRHRLKDWERKTSRRKYYYCYFDRLHKSDSCPFVRSWVRARAGTHIHTQSHTITHTRVPAHNSCFFICLFRTVFQSITSTTSEKNAWHFTAQLPKKKRKREL